jgi:cell division protein FtsQ
MPSVKLSRQSPKKRKKAQRSLFQRIDFRRFSSVMVILGVCVVCIWGYFHVRSLTSYLSERMEVAMGHAGFTLEDVVVEGRIRTDKEHILKILDLKRRMPLLSINLVEAKEKLEKLSWIKAARIDRRLPDTLFIRISETEPAALWQHQNKTYLVDCEGEVSEIKEAFKYKELFFVVGHQAPQHVKHLLELLEKFPDIKARITAATHLRSTRWDLRLDGKVDVRLPEKGVEDALTKLAELEKNHQLTDQEIVTIDMRLPGQLILRLTPDAAHKKNRVGKEA